MHPCRLERLLRLGRRDWVAAAAALITLPGTPVVPRAGGHRGGRRPAATLCLSDPARFDSGLADLESGEGPHVHLAGREDLGDCLLYTSDAADDLLCVDLGG